MVQIKEGAFYRRRDGHIVGPMRASCLEGYPWTCGVNTYTTGGFLFRGDKKDPRDLIEKVPAPAKPAETVEVGEKINRFWIIWGFDDKIPRANTLAQAREMAKSHAAAERGKSFFVFEVVEAYRLDAEPTRIEVKS